MKTDENSAKSKKKQQKITKAMMKSNA